MKKTTKYLAISMAAYMTLNPITILAKEVETISQPNIIMELPVEKDYISYSGTIVEVIKNDERVSLLVKEEGDEYGLIFHIGDEVILLDHNTKEFIGKDELKPDMEISAHYYKHTPMAMSLPGQLTPSVIMVESDTQLNVKISGFNEELISNENDLKLNVSEDTIIVNKKGEKASKEELSNKDLIVFYTASTRSIPAQTNPEKVIIIGERKSTEKPEVVAEEIKVLDHISIDGSEIKLGDSIYTKEDGTKMIPLRQIAEILGYRVEWNNEERSAELTKDSQWTKIVIGEDNYSFAKMLIKLGTAPEIKNTKTYVPFNFLEEVLKQEVNITEEGMINIIE